MAKHKDLIGSRFGKLTVISRSDNLTGRVAFKCLCDCGNDSKKEDFNKWIEVSCYE